MNEAIDGKMFLRWLEILTQRENIAIDFTEIFHHLDHFLGVLADAEHKPALGDEAMMLRTIKKLQARDQTGAFKIIGDRKEGKTSHIALLKLKNIWNLLTSYYLRS